VPLRGIRGEAQQRRTVEDMTIRDVIMTINQMRSTPKGSWKIVHRHDLVDAWAKVERQFLADTP
jgi:hypothetical protein